MGNPYIQPVSCLEPNEAIQDEASMEEESFMKLNYHDMKKWYKESEDLKDK